LSCDEVKNLINDYFDDLLPEVMQKEIESHIKECNSCKNLEKKYNNYFKAIEELPVNINPSINISRKLSLSTEESETISEKEKTLLKGTVIKRLKTQTKIVEPPLIKQKIDQYSQQTVIRGKKKQRLHKKLKKVSFSKNNEIRNYLFNISYVVFISLIVYMVYVLLKDSSDPWAIEIKTGNYKVNGSFDSSFELNSGETISTDEGSEVRVIVPNTALYTLGKNSSMTVKKAFNDENKVILHNGSLKVVSWNPDAFVNVEFRSINLTQYQSSFDIEILSESNEIVLSVNSGDVWLESIRENLRVAKRYALVISPHNKFGIPVREKANKDFKKAVTLYEQGNTELAIIQTITSLAIDEDALTLLEVLRQERIFFEEIYHKLVGFFPPPSTVSKDGLKQRNSSDYNFWWEEIEWQI
jgi:hypothetical protein